MSFGVEQKLDIHELLGRAALAYDVREVDMLTNCFAPDAIFSMRIGQGDLVGPFEGRDAIMQLMTDSMDSQSDVRRHVISNIIFTEIGTDTAKVWSNLTLMATENDEIELLSAGLYQDEVRCTDGIWQISHRHLDLDKAY